MPICTSCTHTIPYLYTVYNSADNLRLEQCTSCHAFADPYIEHDMLTLWLDLILLKRDVYRHLLYNRGTGARILSEQGPKNRDESALAPEPNINEAANKTHDTEGPSMPSPSLELERWQHILRLGSILILVDAFIRWTHFSSRTTSDGLYTDVLRWNQDAVEGFLRILAACLIETVGFHVGVILSSFVILHALDWVRLNILRQQPPRSGIRSEFRYSHIPLTIFYSSLNKLFLLFLLTIWRPASTSPGLARHPLPPQYNASNIFTNPMILGALEVLDDDKLDREWIVRNVLGGMAAGFGLRVVLDCHPLFTTLVVLTGWAVKTALANLVVNWVGAGMAGNVTGEMWLAYSIP
ncbi:Arv1-like family-domain-containing protein [Irpex rosettiformis]|uniref:Arv1-like family-domain-containing protein n=1 Tax=Irpex rosettiformis TaxID=378272 RepID=A0ACB8U7G2_9APHY|nr:Arv1-like family-domain-containing protein [Irpex rosettiformis]